MACPWCAAETVCNSGRDRRGEQVYRCQRCRHAFTDRTGTPFSGYQFKLSHDMLDRSVHSSLASR